MTSAPLSQAAALHTHKASAPRMSFEEARETGGGDSQHHPSSSFIHCKPNQVDSMALTRTIHSSIERVERL